MLAVASQFAEQHQMTQSGKPRRDRSRRGDGIFVALIEEGVIGPDLFGNAFSNFAFGGGSYRGMSSARL
jgi:hypothetical protein